MWGSAATGSPARVRREFKAQKNLGAKFATLEEMTAAAENWEYFETAIQGATPGKGGALFYANGNTGTPTAPGFEVQALAGNILFNASGVGISIRPDKFVTPYNFGAVGDGVADDSDALEYALAVGPVHLGRGTYRVTRTITLPTSAIMIGHSIRGCVIKSDVVGASLFKTDAAGVSFMYLSTFMLEGNNLTGASGNGHAFNFIDPAVSSGSNTPQLSLIENIYIRRFRGTDVCDNGGVTKVASAGVIMYDCLGVTCRKVFVQNCGHGFYARATQNCRLVDCAVEGMQKAGIFSYANQNFVVSDGDYIECGDGSTDAGYPAADCGMGVAISYEDDGFSLIGTKLKSFNGDALIVVKGNSQNVTIERNWIRGTATADIKYRGIYAERIAGLIIRGNLFYPSAGSYAATQSYRAVDLYTPSTAPAFESTIEGNVFMEAPGLTVEFNVGYRGNSNARVHRTTCRANRFGQNASVSSATTVMRDIYFETCRIEASDIGNNSHYAPTNVTRSLGMEASGIAIAKSKIGPDIFQSGGGTITAEYSGISESLIKGAATTWNPPSITTGTTTTTTVTATGAAFGDFVEASLDSDLLGCTLSAQITAANTVTVTLRNDTGSNKDVGNSNVYVNVRKSWAVH